MGGISRVVGLLTDGASHLRPGPVDRCTGRPDRRGSRRPNAEQPAGAGHHAPAPPSPTGLPIDQLAQNVRMSGMPGCFLEEMREHPSQVGVGLLVDTGTHAVEIGRCDDSVDACPRRAVAGHGRLQRVVRTDIVVDALMLDLLAGESVENPQRLCACQMLDQPKQRRTTRDG